MSPHRPAPRAFTLIEVSVAIAVMLILTTVSYLGFGLAGREPQTVTAELTLSSVLTAQKDLARTHGSYSALGEDLGVVGAGVTLLTGAPATNSLTVSMALGSNGSLGLASVGGHGECVVWRVAPLTTGGATTVVDTPGPCTGVAAFDDTETPIEQAGPIR